MQSQQIFQAESYRLILATHHWEYSHPKALAEVKSAKTTSTDEITTMKESELGDDIYTDLLG